MADQNITGLVYGIVSALQDQSGEGVKISQAELEKIKQNHSTISSDLLDQVAGMANDTAEGTFFSREDIIALENKNPSFARELFRTLRNDRTPLALRLFSDSALHYLDDQPPLESAPVGKDIPDFLHEDPALQEKRAHFLRYVRLAKEQGFGLEAVPSAYFVDDFQQSSPNSDIFLGTLKEKILSGSITVSDRSQFFSAQPVPFLSNGDQSLDVVIENSLRPLVEIDPALLPFDPATTPCRVASTMFYCAIQENKCRVTLWDWFEEKPFFSREYDLSSSDPVYYQRAADEICSSLADHLSHSDFDSQIALLPPLTDEEHSSFADHRVYGLQSPEGWSGDQVDQSRKSWRYLTDRFDVLLTTRPVTADVDRDYGRNFLIYPPSELVLSGDLLKKRGYEPLEVKGLMDRFVLTPRTPGAQKVMGQKTRRNFADDFYVDKYGNMVVPVRGTMKGSQKTVLMQVVVVPPYRLLTDPEAEPTQQAMGVDLSPLGLGEYPSLMTLTAIPPERIPSGDFPYYLYSTVPRAEITGQARDAVFEKATMVGRDVERYFGFEPGSRIRHIFLLPSVSENASAKQSNPETVFIWDEIMPMIQSEEGAPIVAHEMYHALDFQFGFSQDHSLTSFFDRLVQAEDTELFDVINESAFRKISQGGHSGENVYEFFASLVNTIDAPTWEESVAGMNDRVRGLYYHALLALKGSLENHHPDFANAPVYRKLGERLRALEAMGPYPGLEQLALLPASRLLTSPPNPIPLIDGASFRKEVLKSDKPVAVYVFQEKERYAVEDVKKFSRDVAGLAKVVALPYDEARFLISPDGTAPFGTGIGSSSIYLFKDGRLVYAPDKGQNLFIPEEREIIFGRLHEKLKEFQ